MNESLMIGVAILAFTAMCATGFVAFLLIRKYVYLPLEPIVYRVALRMNVYLSNDALEVVTMLATGVVLGTAFILLALFLKVWYGA